MQRLIVCLMVLMSVSATFSISPLAGEHQMRVEIVVVITATGRHSFAAEIADTEPLRRQGLMQRAHLAPDRGMLFDNGIDREMHMWMRNTLLALDMIFVTKDGKVVKIAKNTVPHSESIISSGMPVRGVFEVIAGTADRISLKPGDYIKHATFRRK